MAQKSAKDIDTTDADHREIGEGLLEEEMAPSSSMAHLYRGEIHRMKFWRERLDRTTNWAVLVMSGVLTWGFSGPDRPHYILLLGIGALGAFLLMEAQRYRGYDVWRGRVRSLQKNVFAYGLDPSTGLEDSAWREKLSSDYRTPVIKITREEAIAHRLRRIYLLLFTVMLGAWIIHITTFSNASLSGGAAIGAIPGSLVVGILTALYLGAVIIAVRPMRRAYSIRDRLSVQSSTRRYTRRREFMREVFSNAQNRFSLVQKRIQRENIALHQYRSARLCEMLLMSAMTRCQDSSR